MFCFETGVPPEWRLGPQSSPSSSIDALIARQTATSSPLHFLIFFHHFIFHHLLLLLRAPYPAPTRSRETSLHSTRGPYGLPRPRRLLLV